MGRARRRRLFRARHRRVGGVRGMGTPRSGHSDVGSRLVPRPPLRPRQSSRSWPCSSPCSGSCSCRLRCCSRFSTTTRSLPVCASCRCRGWSSCSRRSLSGWRGGRDRGRGVRVGLVITASGLAAGATIDADSGYGVLAVALTLTGIGMGSTVAPTVESLMSTVPPTRAGVTSAVRQHHPGSPPPRSALPSSGACVEQLPDVDD